MSCSYRTIIAAVGTRCNALVGATTATLQTAYTTSPLTSAEFQSTIFPFADIKESVLWAEEKLATAIGDTADHPWRQSLADNTSALTNPSTLPALSTNSKPIVGAWGAVKDGSSGMVCSEMPLDIVRRKARSSLTVATYWYNIVGGRIEHTRTSVIIECCVYSRTDQSTALEANGNILLPDALEQAYVCGAMSMLIRDDEFAGQAATYSGYFQNALQAIVSGLSTVQGAAVAA